MTNPLPWSTTAIDDFANCPWAYREKRVLKKVREVKGEPQIWGDYVHKSFEMRQGAQQPLPLDLMGHKPFMEKLDKIPGLVPFVEQKIALNKKLQPCEFFDPDVWYRGVMDWQKHDMPQKFVSVVDYKTGKPHKKWRQLYIYALHTFIAHPSVELVDVRFYWTRDCSETRKVMGRADIEMMWGEFMGDLRQYKDAFKSDVWQKRPGGLCNGWCPVTDCEHWKPKRSR